MCAPGLYVLKHILAWDMFLYMQTLSRTLYAQHEFHVGFRTALVHFVVTKLNIKFINENATSAGQNILTHRRQVYIRKKMRICLDHRFFRMVCWHSVISVSSCLFLCYWSPRGWRWFRCPVSTHQSLAERAYIIIFKTSIFNSFKACSSQDVIKENEHKSMKNSAKTCWRLSRLYL